MIIINRDVVDDENNNNMPCRQGSRMVGTSPEGPAFVGIYLPRHQKRYVHSLRVYWPNTSPLPNIPRGSFVKFAVELARK